VRFLLTAACCRYLSNFVLQLIDRTTHFNAEIQ